LAPIRAILAARGQAGKAPGRAVSGTIKFDIGIFAVQDFEHGGAAMGHLRSLVLPLVLLASDHADPTRVAVDVELVLAADTSSSMDVEERQAQVDGYANAFRDGALIANLLSGPTGRIAVTYVEWSEEQRVIVPWTLISNVHDAERLAAAIAHTPVYHDSHGTNITGALKFSAAALRLNQFAGRRLVIDISGDGENNFQLPPDPVRDAIAREGITINGLSLEIREDKKKDWRNEPTASYYAAHVIGGPGAFLVSAYGMEDFEGALKRKLAQEMVVRLD
jgi:hypothetical protein